MLLFAVGDTGATYTTAQGEPMLSMAWAGHGWLHLQPQSRIRLEQKFGIIIVTNASAVCYTSEPKLCVPDSKMAYSGIQATLSLNPYTPDSKMAYSGIQATLSLNPYTPDSKMAYSGIQATLSLNPYTPNKAARGKSNCSLPHSFTQALPNPSLMAPHETFIWGHE